MDGHDYEHLVAKYLRGRGYTGVKVTKGSGDYGVDVVAHKAGHKYAVQCKYYTAPVSLGAVQEAVAGKAFYNCDRAMVVTNSSFTKAAQELAKANDVVLLEAVRSVGTFRFSQLPKGTKMALLGAYLFVASAAFVAMLNINKGRPLGTAAYNVIATMAVLLFPIWVSPAIRGVKRLFRYALARAKMGKATPKSTQDTVADQPTRPAIDAKALQPYLPVEVQDRKSTFADALSGLPVLTTSDVQRKCKCGYNCATSILRNFQVYGLIKETQQSTYEWTEKALLLGAGGHNG